MLQLRLSLLSPSKKQLLHKLVRFLFTKELLEIVIFTCSLLAITHLVGWLILTQTVVDLAQSSLIVNRAVPAYAQNINHTNKIIKDVFAAGQDFDLLSARIITLANAQPNDIRLTSLEIDRDRSMVLIDGVAATRDSLLAYEKILSSIPWLTDVSAPASQLFEKENVGFELQMKLKVVPKLRPLPQSTPTVHADTSI